MQVRLPFLNLKAKLIALMVVLLAMTLGAEMMVSLQGPGRDRQHHAGEGQRSRQRNPD